MTARYLDILLHDESIGQLVQRADDRIECRFATSYLEDPGRAVLGQYFLDHPVRSFVEKYQYGPPPRFFGHLLPEGLLRRLLLDTHELEETDPLGLLEIVGHDLPGALVIQPTTDEIEGDLTESFEGSAPDARTEDPGLRFSLAGVQLKFSVVRDQDTLNLPVRGQRGNWIVKLANPVFKGLPENEWSMMAWARESGFDVPDCELVNPSAIRGVPESVSVHGETAFAIRRFDRAENTRVHQEDFCQVLNLPTGDHDKYQHQTYDRLGRLVQAITGERGLEEFVRRFVFVLASGNADAHLKNWSLIYPDRRSACLSPLYDQVATVAWPGLDQRLALKFAGVRTFQAIDLKAIERFSKTAGCTFNIMDVIESTIDRIRDSWNASAASWPLLSDHRERIRSHWKSIPVLSTHGPLD